MPLIKPFIGSLRFTATAGDGTGTGAGFNILATAFLDDAGVSATEFPTLPAYYNLYINALLQAGDVSSVTTTEITIPDGDTLNGAVPIVVEFVVN